MKTELTHKQFASKGGVARAKKLTKKRRKEIATKASMVAKLNREKRVINTLACKDK